MIFPPRAHQVGSPGERGDERCGSGADAGVEERVQPAHRADKQQQDAERAGRHRDAEGGMVRPVGGREGHRGEASGKGPAREKRVEL